MRPLIVLCAFLACVGCSGPSTSAAPPPVGNAHNAATSALATLQKLVTQQNYKSLGFESVDEVKSATLGTPIAISTIGLDQLKTYKPGVNPATLLHESPESMYPVLAGNQVRTAVTLVKKEAGFTTSGFGNAPLMRAVSRYMPATGTSTLVRVPALNLYFVATRGDGELTLTLLAEDPRLDLRAGQPVPATRVLEMLVPVANAYNGLPE